MDPITQQTTLAAAGGKKDPVYVDDVFSTYLYDGTSGHSINNGIDLAGEGGLVWIKNRTTSNRQHALFDTDRGINEVIRSNNVGTENNYSNTLTSFNSNGFTVGNDPNTSWVNNSSDRYVSWTFRKAPGFFDVVTYSGNGSVRTFAHNLKSAPGMIWIKMLTGDDRDWIVYHRSLGATKNLRLNETDTFRTATNEFNDTEPTSTHFTVGTDSDVNGTGKTYVAYIFAHEDASFGTDEDESIIKCGSYTATSTSREVIDVGFEPQWLLIKNTTASSTNWMLFDTMRSFQDNGDSKVLFPNEVNDEMDGGEIKPFSNGFQIDNNDQNLGYAGETYIYMAIRRPNKPPELATEVFAIDTGSSSSTIPTFDSGFPVDFAIHEYYTLASRLTGTKFSQTFSDAYEASTSNHVWDSMEGWGTNYATNTSYMFKRAPSFADVVTWRGTGAYHEVKHNLKAIPEFILLKTRNTYRNWMAFLNMNQSTYTYSFFTNQSMSTQSYGSGYKMHAPPDSEKLYWPDYSFVNGSNDEYIAYLFATLPGISKVGSYNGNGGTQDIDCGFTNGARFIMIRRTNAGGDFFIFDTQSGIVSNGNDPHYYLQRNTNPTTNADHVEPYSQGFSLVQTDYLNAVNDTYFFLAIA